MGAPEHLQWQFAQARARRRLRRLRMIELAGWHVAIFCTGIGGGVLMTLLLR